MALWRGLVTAYRWDVAEAVGTWYAGTAANDQG
jgi:hypothetical protein